MTQVKDVKYSLYKRKVESSRDILAVSLDFCVAYMCESLSH